MSTYYTYVHLAGYSRVDHLAPELIARAARRLGLDTGSAIAAACGLVSHAVPSSCGEVRVSSSPTTRRRMLSALRAARGEFFGLRGRARLRGMPAAAPRHPAGASRWPMGTGGVVTAYLIARHQ